MGLDMQHVMVITTAAPTSDNNGHSAPQQEANPRYQHADVFECAICQGLVDLDCLVTTTCSHCFCRPCLKQWLERKRDDTVNNMMPPGSFIPPPTPRCPTCNKDLLHSHHNNNNSKYHGGTMMMADQSVTVQPLSTAQPLAHRVLQRIQVSCPLRPGLSDCIRCSWRGDYGDLQHHLLSKTSHNVMNTEDDEEGNVVGDQNKAGEEESEPMQVDANDAQDDAHHTTVATQAAKAKSAAARRVGMATSFKEEANTQFAAQHYRAARDLYTKALDILQTRPLSATSSPTAITVDDDEAESGLAATLYANRAATHLALQDDYARAHEDAMLAIQANPAYQKAYLRAARALVQLGDFSRAALVLQQGVALEAKSGSVSTVLNKEYEATRAMQANYDRAEAYMKKSEFAGAKAVWGRLLGETGAANVVLGMARADLGLGLTDSTMRLTRQVLKKDPHSADAFTLRGHCHVLMCEGESGLKLLKQAMRLDPDSSTTLAVYKECSKTLSLRKEATDCIFHRKFEQAIQLLTEAITKSQFLPPKSPLYASLYTERAKAHLRRKEYEAALKDCAMVVYHREDDVEAWLIRFQALHGLERHEEVLEEASSLMQKWGSNEDRIRRAHEKADFQVRKQKRPDFYKLLGITPVASEREVKKAYRQASLDCHPDRLVGNDFTDAQRKAGQQRFQLLGEGLEILTDDFKRQLYDEGYDPEAIKERVEAAQRAAHQHGDHFHGSRGHSAH